MSHPFEAGFDPWRAAGRSVVIAAVLALGACVAINVQRSAEMPIAASRMQPVNTPVIIEGVVTVASGALDEGFAVQDASGGIYISRTLGPPAVPGDRVRVTGTIVLPGSQQIAVEPVGIGLLGRGNVPEPLDVKTGAVGPATEGRLIRVQGKIIGGVEDDQPYGWKIYLDDGSGRLLVFIAAKTRINTKSLRAGQQLRVTGFSGRYEKHTEVLPRGPADVVNTGGKNP